MNGIPIVPPSLLNAGQAAGSSASRRYSNRSAIPEAIRRHNEHIESCTRLIEAGQDDAAELQRIRKELADTQAENKSPRSQLAGTQKITAEIAAQGKIS
jgi:hypothetical protein